MSIFKDPKRIDAIKALCPKASFTLTGGTVIKWYDMNGETVPTDSEIDAKLAELKTTYDNAAYARNRSDQYASIKTQLDQIYWDKKNGTNKWVEAIDKVKSDNPKP